MKKHMFASAIVLAAIGSPAFAGYTAITTTDTVNTPSTGGPVVGDLFSTATSGGFTSFIGDTPNDPTLTGNDLPYYRYTLDGSITSINSLTDQIEYTGAYSIFYDLNLDGTFETGEPTVSTGDFTIFATFLPGTNDAALTGDLTQTAGPSNPAFADLSEGGRPVLYTGTYDGNDPGVSGTIQGTLRQNAVVVPEPASMGILCLGGLLLGRRRRS
jgi:hypothetical protein